MLDKYLVIYQKEKGYKEETTFKTFKDIQKQYNIQTHTLLDIYRVCEGLKSKSYVHPKNKEIYNRMKIFHIKHKIELN